MPYNFVANNKIELNYQGFPLTGWLMFWFKGLAADTTAKTLFYKKQSNGQFLITIDGNNTNLQVEVNGKEATGENISALLFYSLSTGQVTNGFRALLAWNMSEYFTKDARPSLWLDGVKHAGAFAVRTPKTNAVCNSFPSTPWILNLYPWGGPGQVDTGSGAQAEVALSSGVPTNQQAVELTTPAPTGKNAQWYPDKLLFYYPFKADAKDWISDATATITGATLDAVAANHPAVTAPANPVKPTPPPAPDPALTLRDFFAGNSMTDGVGPGPDGLGSMIETAGLTQVFGRHVIPGAPLATLEAEPNGGYSTDGGVTIALGAAPWTNVSVQPFDRYINATSTVGDGDFATILRFMDIAKNRAATDNKPQFWIHMRTPRKPQKPGGGNFDAELMVNLTADAWDALWTAPYADANSNSRSYETRAFFTQLLTAIRAARIEPNYKQIKMVPIGEVFYALNQKMKAGQVSGYTKIWQFYEGDQDQIHWNGLGAYTAACTFYVCYTRKTAVGLPVPPLYGTIAAAIRGVIQQTVDETVLAQSAWTGLASFGTADTTAPTAALGGITPPTTTGSTAAIAIPVTYTDNVEIDASSLAAANLEITSPGGGVLTGLTLTSTEVITTKTQIKGNYSLAAPSGGWTATQNGTYTVKIKASQVKDLGNNYVAAATLGTFAINIGAVGTGTTGMTDAQIRSNLAAAYPAIANNPTKIEALLTNVKIAQAATPGKSIATLLAEAQNFFDFVKTS